MGCPTHSRRSPKDLNPVSVKRESLSTITLLSILGLTAGCLSIVIPALLTGWTSPLFVGSSLGIFPGDIFGAAISVYFLVFAGIRSVVKATALIVSSAFAYFMAMLIGIFGGGFLSASMGLQANHASAELDASTVLPVSIAGSVGAWIVLAAVLRIYSETSWRRVVAKSTPWSLVGGLLGLVGWGLGPSLGSATLAVLEFLHLETMDKSTAAAGGTLNGYSGHLVWQSGMGVVLGIVLSETRLLLPTRANEPTAAARKWSISNLILFGLILLAIVSYTVRWLPIEYRDLQGNRAFAKHFATRPSAESLPQIAIAPADTILIVAPFDRYEPDRPHAGTGHWSSGPKPQVYSVRYRLPGAPDSGPDVGPHVDVQIQDWPNPDWANWELAEQGFSTAHKGIEESNRFGNRILQTQGDPKAPNRWGTSARYGWSSGNRVIFLDVLATDPTDFLKRYLEKYPSTY